MFFRHHNGNGKKGEFAEVCPNSVIDKAAFVRGDSDVINSKIKGVSEIENVHCVDSLLLDAFASNCFISNSAFVNSEISIELAYSSKVFGSILTGKTKLRNAHVENCKFSNLNVFDAEIKNVSGDFNTITKLFDSLNFYNGYIVRGVWMRPPRFIAFPKKNVTLMESVAGFLTVNCTEKPLEQWIARAVRYGRKFGLNKSEIKKTITFARLLQKKPFSPSAVA